MGGAMVKKNKLIRRTTKKGTLGARLSAVGLAETAGAPVADAMCDAAAATPAAGAKGKAASRFAL